MAPHARLSEYRAQTLDPHIPGTRVTQEETLLALLEDHAAAMRRIAGVYAGADGEEEDLYQEILVQVWRSLPSFRGNSTAGTWLYRVALNTALTWRRKASKRASLRAASPPLPGGVPAASHDSQRSQTAILTDFLGSLGGPDRSVLLLYMEGLSYQEIADVTGLSVSAVGVRLHRMKETFTDRFVER